MSDQMTAEQAQAQIVAEEYANQNATLIQRLATERVRALQLEQSLGAAYAELAELRSSEDPSPADEPENA